MRITVQSEQKNLVYDTSVVGYSIVSVVKTEDGGLDVNRYFHVEGDWGDEDKQVATDFLKKAEDKLSELFPSEPVPESKLWVPDGY